jgi:translation initiation factor IF-3
MRIHRHRIRKAALDVQQYRVNHRIKSEQVRVIDEDGTPLGVMTLSDALKAAQAKERDLVEVSPKAEPPVCKILDYGQFKYQKEKEAKKQKAQSKVVEVKGVRLSVRIGDHDLEVRINQATKFFEQGDKVQVELPLRGREKAHKDVAQQVMEKFLESMKTRYEVRIEQQLKFLNGRFTMIIARV